MYYVNKFEVVKYVLDCIIRVVGKRKSDLFAITTLAEIIKQLESRYDFLKHIKVDTKVFSETWIAIQVDQKIDSVDGEILGKAIDTGIYS